MISVELKQDFLSSNQHFQLRWLQQTRVFDNPESSEPTMATPVDSTSPGDNQSVTEVIVRLLTTHIFGLGLYGHFGSLANIPSETHALHVVVFLFNPSLIVAQICLGIFKAVQYYGRHPDCRDAGSFTFYFDGIIGVHADRVALVGNSLDPGDDNDTKALPLFVVGYRYLRRTTQPVSWAWFGRVLISLAAVAQSLGTCVIFVRRQSHGCGLLIDMTLGIMAFASSITAVLVIYLLMRSKWCIDSSNHSLPDPPRAQYGTARSLFDAVIIAAIIVAPLRGSYFLFIFLYPLQILFFNPAILELLVITLLLGYIFRRARYSHTLAMFLCRWVGFVFIVMSVTLVAEDIILSLVQSFQELATTDHGCWKDPLSDMLLVI